MAKIKKNFVELIGKTPLLAAIRFGQKEGLNANIFAKLEYFNPGGSVKDRIAAAIIQAAAQSGQLKPGGTIVEATSGNTGIGLSAVGAALGYKVVIVMPETMSIERRKLMLGYGAQLILTDGSQGMKGAIAKAKESKGELTEDDVRKIVEDTLKNYKLDQVVTGNQVNVIINFAFNLSKSDILNNEDFTKTLKDLKQSIVAQAGDSFSNIDLNFDANKAIQDGGNILSSIWQAILDFFKSFGA